MKKLWKSFIDYLTEYRPDVDPGVWFITAIHFKVVAVHEKTGELKTKRVTRTFGYYRDWNSAFAAVLENRGSMHECLYDFIVMEKIGEGIHASVTDEQWFNWNGKKWIMCQRPKEMVGTTNWAIG